MADLMNGLGMVSDYLRVHVGRAGLRICRRPDVALPLLDDDFLGTKHSVIPKEAVFDAADHKCVIVGIVGALDRNSPLSAFVELARGMGQEHHIEAGKDFDNEFHVVPDVHLHVADLVEKS